MSDVTLQEERPVPDRPKQQRNSSRSKVLLRFEAENSPKPQILARKLRFSAAC